MRRFLPLPSHHCEPPSRPDVIYIQTLGGLSVRDSDGKPIAGTGTQPRRMAVLALLARAGDWGMSRDKILALLWPDAEDERGPRALTQALYALRKNLGSDDAITGARELRLDPAFVSSDASEFASAVSRGDDGRAVALYQGPFLDGFNLTGAEEFARWVDQERASLASDYSRALESLARATRAKGDAHESVMWWRKLAAIEPLNSRVAVGLMEALASSGDRTAAIQHARVYEMLVEQQLDLPADKEVVGLARRLRAMADERAAPESTAPPPASPPATPPASALGTSEAVPAAGIVRESVTSPPVRAPVSGPGRSIARVASIVIGVAAVAAVVLVARSRSSRGAASIDATLPVVAVGNIATFGTDSTGLTAPVADLLTTSLARVPTIRVISHGRMLELMHSLGFTTDTGQRGLVNAARQAGATEVVDGTLYARPGGRLRLDLRRVDLATGAIGDVHTVEGNDLFALVDSGTARLLASLGSPVPAGSVADVTTRSVTAYRMYENGIRAYYRGDLHTALGFFDGALGEDSLFALAAYYAALSDGGVTTYSDRMERAKRLAVRASDRERLTILVGWARTVSSPAMRAIAETLATRYPAETEGHLYSGIARVVEGDFLAAIAPLQRVVAMDSLGLRGGRARCSGCEALAGIVSAYQLADSLPTAEREARRWLRLQPNSLTAVAALVNVLELAGRGVEADSLMQAATAGRELPYAKTVDFRAAHLIRAGEYAAADSILRAQLREPDPQQQANALWDLAISLREQGRLADAVTAAHRIRAANARIAGWANAPSLNELEAQALLEAGRPSAAAALFDSLAQQHAPTDAPSRRARGSAWMLTQSAGARAAAGDTASLARLADSIGALGEQSGYGRDRRLHHHVRGLLFAARGADRQAIDELKSAIYSISAGYTRTNYELARVYLHAGRPRDAVAVLQPVLRGPLDASNLYLNRIELQELLAQAWDATGQRDSAAAHYSVVARAWSNGDALFKARAERARSRAAGLGR